MKTLVIIPAYNEEKNIVSTVESLRAHCLALDLLVVNDGSSDATGALCREHGYPLVELPVNLGIGGSVQTGYLYALAHGYDAASASAFSALWSGLSAAWRSGTSPAACAPPTGP